MGAVNVYVLVGLLASLSYTITAIPTSILNETDTSKAPATPCAKVLVYKYSATVSAGQNKPSAFASKFELRGKVIYWNNSESNELSLRDVEYAIYNGHEDGQVHGNFLPVDNEHIYKPVRINYNEDHQIKDILISSSEDAWTKNLKKSLALLFHVDLTNKDNSSAYHRFEQTGHGKCRVDYSMFKLDDGQTIVEKTYEPKKCSDFVGQQATDSNADSCDIPAEDDLATIARKIFTVGKLEDTTREVIKKVSSHEKMDYLPWEHRSYGIQFIETTQDLEFERVAEPTEFNVVPAAGDSESILFEHGGILTFNPTNDQDDLRVKVKELLVEMIGFLKDNQIDIDTKNPEHKYLLDKLYGYLGSTNKESLHYLWKHFTTSEKGSLARKIFLRMIPHVGTAPVWEFALEHIRDVNGSLSEEAALGLLAKLPIYVKDPSIAFVETMEWFANFQTETHKPSYKLQQAGVLCYSILINKAIKASGNQVLPKEFKKFTDLFYDHIKFENTYAKKIVYMMALRNIGYDIYDYLAPIARGDTNFYVDVMIEKREKYQIAAMWAVAKSINKDYSRTYELFWPILANVSLPVSTRIAAYELLVSRNPLLDMNILMRVHELMTVEKNEHLFNYHYTTLRSNSESTSPCMKLHAEMMRKVWRLTKSRKVFGLTLSGVSVNDYYDPMYGHGKTLRMAADFNENSGFPQYGYAEMISTNLRKPTPTFGYQWNVDGISLNTMIRMMNEIDFSADIHTGISNKDIREILKKTQGHKLFDSHIHVEWWTLDQGYVTNVDVYFESSLVDLIRNFNNKYKLNFDSIMEAETKYNIDALDISFANHYEMTATNDMGLSVHFVNYVPSIWRAKLNPRLIAEKSVAMTIDFDARYHRHSVVQMKFLNPIINSVHSVERRIVTDAALPIDVTFSLQYPTDTLKIELPQLTKESSAMGLKIHSFDRVVVDGHNVEKHLQAHCPTCKNQLDITKGPSHKTNNLQVSDHLDSGLEFTYGMFDCEHDFEPDAEKQEWNRIFNLPRNNWESDVFEKFFMVVDNGMFNYVNNPYTGTCGMIMKVARCTKHPVSHIEMSMRKSVTASENGSGLIVRGNVDIISAESNVSMRSWEADLGLEISNNSQALNVKLTRKVPEEQDLKICASFLKASTKVLTDVMNMEYKTQSELHLKMGHNNLSDQCPTDLIDIKAVIIGERLEEQIEEMNYDVNPASCFKKASNSLGFEITRPFDWDCLNQAIRATTLRKYTVDITYGEMPIEYYGKLQMIQDWAQFVTWPRITYKPQYTEKGHAKLYIAYPFNKNYGNITFVNPYHTIELIDVVYEEDEGDKERPYDVVFDNVIFPTMFLTDYYYGGIRPCIVHPNQLINDMNQTVAMEFKDWTLMYGEYGLMTYAVFVKTLPDGKLAVRVYDRSHTLEISPGESKPIIKIDGLVENLDETTTLKEHTLGNYKVTAIGQFTLINTHQLSLVRILYSPYNVVVMPHIAFDRSIDGVCGHMGTNVYTQQVPLVYSSSA